jgi:hypothetical protein
LARLASEIAEALIRGAMGLLVSVFAVWCFNYLRSRFEVFENEMSRAELEAVACLKAHPQWREQFEHSSAAKRIFAVADASAACTWEVPYDRQRPLLLAMWCCALFLAYVFGSGRVVVVVSLRRIVAQILIGERVRRERRWTTAGATPARELVRSTR